MQKWVSMFSLVVVAALLAALGGNLVTAAPRTQATQAATMAGTQAALTIPGTGKITGPVDGEAKRLNASGATFPKPLYDEWARAYRALTGVEINYAGGGSGQGKKDVSSLAVDYAGSDSFMNDKELADAKGGALVHIPTAIGAIVPVYNIPELKSKDAVKFSGDTLAGIYLGEITKWNDPKLVADNPALQDVNADILPVYRSDGSGTTQNFTAYLSFVNKTWADQIKSGTTVKWPAGRGANGNPGVANEVKQNEYAIGYVELAFAKDLQTGLVKDAAGKFVAATTETISASMAGVQLPDDLRITLIGKSNPDAYPIVALTWLLVYTDQKDAAKGLALTRFLWWATHDGQAFHEKLGYAPLPLDAIRKAEANILKITVGGKQALPADITASGQ
ncbi:MAG: phosphate ABC transporter substrate-binding protein PstS [Anaerolineae bacterium]|nr:phosphate ABC transporter substrate-binding protein PstS [Anaerolineae bacterium]